jgi:hypothetical protein
MKRSNILLTVLALLFGLSSCKLEYPHPTDGVWYCEELQAQFTFGQGDIFDSSDDIFDVDESENYIVVNNDRIASRLNSDLGAKYVMIVCMESNHPDFYFREAIYSLEFVSLSGTEYVVKDKEGKEYIFLRISDTPTDD